VRAGKPAQLDDPPCARGSWCSSTIRTGRPGLDAAFAAVASGEADGLIVPKLDRLSRSVRDLSEILARFQRTARHSWSSTSASTRRRSRRRAA
jgi:DNA invertase Pin-like site-specific DNA recombinase